MVLRSTLTVSPIGDLILSARSDELVACQFADHTRTDNPYVGVWVSPADSVLSNAAEELAAYFEGELRTFAVPHNVSGPAFSERVWRALEAIPYGETVSYGDIARKLGKPGAARAVGSAVGRNPLCIVLPCHRVIGADGSITGFTGGVERKRALLQLEYRATHAPHTRSADLLSGL
ncbi:methylated-DNA--[protein]-cysteine S-methyltransferase [Gleimia hominis]|uniref:Methylated-DNA--protein-cysteine methyltransferase n=1 Tax=Gleimia hominis TaxID=595468 RepID=A0ABU3IB52_9ACTO|nr:methylated-DNA--[protein]-cysteine S-methyltransferase [Gleimia hominis]MDT3767608.1 methylated-DNA--[protein]-cysteine S-methyltransferase [Gleimia hominis]